jgi:hypothetical protein
MQLFFLNFINMKSLLSLTIAFILCICLFSCQSSSEEFYWEGLVSQDDNFGISSSYKSTLKWTQKGDKIKGEGYYEAPQDTSSHVLYSFDGTKEGDTIRLKETGIIFGTEIEGEWLTKDIVLYYPNEDKSQLRGKWVAHRKRNIGGVMKYAKKSLD